MLGGGTQVQQLHSAFCRTGDIFILRNFQGSEQGRPCLAFKFVILKVLLVCWYVLMFQPCVLPEIGAAFHGATGFAGGVSMAITYIKS